MKRVWCFIIGIGIAGWAIAGGVGAVQQKAVPSTRLSLEQRIAAYERWDRDEWQKPDEVIRVLAVREGMVVADIGAGSGYFTRRFAQVVGEGGKVYAVDIDREMLGFLEWNIRRLGIKNVEIVVGEEGDPHLPPESVDVAFLCDTTHHMANRVEYLRRLRRALKSGGKVAIIDYPPEASRQGFCPHRPEELVPREQILQEAQEAGYTLVHEFTFLLPRQYFLVFQKEGRP